MPLQVGARLGPYEVLALIDAGGMGEVYRAKDTKLGRDVAIKVLPDAVAGDPDRLARFHREAQVLASLNHPSIAHIHGYEDFGGTQALVMELVEGPTLADRIAQGPIPLNEALPIAKQIAEALETAHEQGIIHRDLKPANIKVREDGTVKVLDFGLAKMMDPASGSGLQAPANVTASPTITTPAMMTGIGVILGTAAYMSPEQAKGRQTDKRSDVWAFGCVLYEVLTGKRAFLGDDVTEVLASVIKSTPDWSLLPQLPPLVDVFLRQSLEKDWKKRLGDIREFRLAIEGAFDLAAFGDSAATPNISPRFTRAQIAAAVVIVAAAAAIGLGVSRLKPAVVERPTPVVRFEVFPPAGGQFPGANYVPRMELSPDGRYLAFTATQANTSAQQLWVRRLDATEARPLTTFPELQGEPVQNPFWSPDSQNVGFFIDGTLRRISVDGSGMQTLATMSGNNYGGAWNADGTILFSSVGTAGLRRVSAAGGTPTQVTKLQSGESSHLWPQFLPDGRHFLYLASGPDGSEVFATSIDSPARTSVQKTPWMARFVLPGYLLFFRTDSLMAQRFDPQTLALQGEPVLLADQVQQSANGRLGVTASDTGVLAFRRGTTSRTADSQLAWVDRNGRELGAVGPEASFRGLALSPDGRYAAVHREDGEGGDIWLLDLERNTMGRMTFDPARHNVGPVWSADGKSVIFSKVRGGTKTPDSWSIYQRNADGTGEERLLFEAGAIATLPWTVSPDGSTLLFSSGTEKEREVDLWTLQLRGAPNPQRYLQAPGRQYQAQFSPDGRWVAYTSDETGRNEVYVQSYPQPGTKYQISGSGGHYPRWRRDGRELLYRSLQYGSGLAQPVLAVPVETVAASLRFGTPVTLFSTAVLQQHVSGYFDYAPGADGQKYLRVRRSGALGDEASRASVTVVVNWTEELKARVPATR